MSYVSVGNVGVGNSQPTRFLSMMYVSDPGTSVLRFIVNTNFAVPPPSVSYGGVAATCIDPPRDDLPLENIRVEHHYEIHSPPTGSQILSLVFTEDVFCAIHVFELPYVHEFTLRGEDE